jgi:hypothetical protein
MQLDDTRRLRRDEDRDRICRVLKIDRGERIVQPSGHGRGGAVECLDGTVAQLPEHDRIVGVTRPAGIEGTQDRHGGCLGLSELCERRTVHWSSIASARQVRVGPNGPPVNP